MIRNFLLHDQISNTTARQSRGTDNEKDEVAQRFLTALPGAFVQIESRNRDIYEQHDKRNRRAT